MNSVENSSSSPTQETKSKRFKEALEVHSRASLSLPEFECGGGKWDRMANGGTVARKTVIQEAISLIVAKLAAEDSQAEHEESGGGLRTVTFADGHALDIGDLNPGNLRQKWARIHWAGGTRIMPGLNTLTRVYNEEFGAKPQDERPLLLALVITDGEADDTEAFTRAVARASGSLYVVLAILGYGPEHDSAMLAYQQVAATNAHVKVMSFAGETDPETIAGALLRMIA